MGSANRASSSANHTVTVNASARKARRVAARFFLTSKSIAATDWFDSSKTFTVWNGTCSPMTANISGMHSKAVNGNYLNAEKDWNHRALQQSTQYHTVVIREPVKEETELRAQCGTLRCSRS